MISLPNLFNKAHSFAKLYDLLRRFDYKIKPTYLDFGLSLCDIAHGIA